MSKKFPYKIEILYKDDDCVVINKPAGLMVHPDGRAPGPFLTDWILEKFPKAKHVGETITGQDGKIIDRPGIVHRLDRETSGAILIALTTEAHAHFKKQFQERSLTKKYLAFVWGEILEEFGTITRPIGRNGSDFRKWSAQRGARGEIREAETYWTRLWTGAVPGSREKFSLLEAEPKTGRTHQIRVHFNAIHHPVVSDKLYAPKRPEALGFTRNALHSKELEFETLNGQRVKVEASFPDDFAKVIKEMKIKIK